MEAWIFFHALPHNFCVFIPSAKNEVRFYLFDNIYDGWYKFLTSSSWNDVALIATEIICVVFQAFSTKHSYVFTTIELWIVKNIQNILSD
jgi:hypothetical protein